MTGILAAAAAKIANGASCLDVGAGIRPQPYKRFPRHVCVEPHDEYAGWLRSQGWEVIQGPAPSILWKAPQVDVAFLLDVVEHMTREDGTSAMEIAKQRARQVVVFTPLGFLPQSYAPGEKDAWGYNGAHWQTHRSGWTPDDFPGWDILADSGFHGTRGGAFFAIWGQA